MIKNVYYEMLKKYYSHFSTADGIFFIYFVTDFLRLYQIIPVFIGNVAYVVIGLTSIGYTINRRGLKRQKVIVMFWCAYSTFGIIGVFTNGNIDIQEILWPFAFMGLSMLLLNFTISTAVSKFMYIFAVITFITNILVVGSINEVSLLTSRNSVSTIMLFYFCVYSISMFENKHKISIIYPLLGLFVSVLSIGRSGILTFLLLLILLLLFEFKFDKYSLGYIKKLFPLIIPIMIFIAISYCIFDDFILETFNNISTRGLESTRGLIWSEYLFKTFKSPLFIIFGTPISGTHLLDLYHENLHNSLLMVHAKYGLIQLVIILFMIVKAIVVNIKLKNYLFLTLIITVIFRMQFDYTNFNAQLDIVFFYLIFYVSFNLNLKTKMTK